LCLCVLCVVKIGFLNQIHLHPGGLVHTAGRTAPEQLMCEL